MGAAVLAQRRSSPGAGRGQSAARAGPGMGAFLAALIASGLDSVEIARVARDTFVRANFLNDYAIPRYSIIRGRKFAQRLREIFGEQRIEDLRRPFFCVSTNLTTGQ